MNVIVTTNIPGNFHNAADWINRCGLADYLLQLDFTGSNTIAVFRMPQAVHEHLVQVKTL